MAHDQRGVADATACVKTVQCGDTSAAGPEEPSDVNWLAWPVLSRRDVELKFDRGTLVLLNPPVGLEVRALPGAMWDPRTAEYRLPVAKDVGFSLLGFYFERVTCAPFIDLLGWRDPAFGPGNVLKEKTYGIQLRQRLFFLGRHFADMGFYWAYDPKETKPNVLRLNISPGF